MDSLAQVYGELDTTAKTSVINGLLVFVAACGEILADAQILHYVEENPIGGK